ncbi:hypothetical protein [Clostridium sp. DJ247]|uniref:hypothetical protein n=1 Tax=Clostridium sp. DJ247 TaxID=2726188 RepID=UPI0016231F41|nr:hypothetical protein [Clostridium sp. DJ247]MBC2580901.1 hypothetical protein [Clostridium sp. DJ247]
MLFFLFIVLVGFSLYVSYYFSNKLHNQRKQLLLLKYQNNALKHNVKTNDTNDIIIKYITPLYNRGIVITNCKLLLSPLSNSTVLNILNENTVIEIQDSAEVNYKLWYEISLITDDRTNSKGWVKSEHIKFLSNTELQ